MRTPTSYIQGTRTSELGVTRTQGHERGVTLTPGLRYRARNAPESLNEAELSRWNTLRHSLLFNADSGSTLIYSDYKVLMEELQNDPTADQEVLTKLDEFVSQSVAGFVG